MWCWGGDDYGLPPGPSRERRATSVARPPAYRLHIAYVTPSRLATRTASSNSPSACACHLDVVSSQLIIIAFTAPKIAFTAPYLKADTPES